MFSVSRHLFTPQTSNNHRPRILHVEGLGVLLFILISAQGLIRVFNAAPGPLPAILGFSSSITASQVVDRTNDKRSEAGLAKLTVNQKLVAAAIAKGNNMCQDQYWAHISPSGTTPWVFIKNAGYKYSVAGENLARDFADTTSMVDAWMASPTHKANIVSGKYKEIGVAVIDCKLLGSDTALVVQMFGSQSTPTAKKPAVTPKAIAQQQSKVQGEEITAGDEELVFAQATPDPTFGAIVQDETERVTPNDTPLPDTTGLRAFTMLELTKAVSLSVILLLCLVLSVDLWVSQERNTVRIVGKNIGHLIFIGGILLVVLLLKAGVIG